VLKVQLRRQNCRYKLQRKKLPQKQVLKSRSTRVASLTDDDDRLVAEELGGWCSGDGKQQDGEDAHRDVAGVHHLGGCNPLEETPLQTRTCATVSIPARLGQMRRKIVTGPQDLHKVRLSLSTLKGYQPHSIDQHQPSLQGHRRGHSQPYVNPTAHPYSNKMSRFVLVV
jgi:hypothetical protein